MLRRRYQDHPGAGACHPQRVVHRIGADTVQVGKSVQLLINQLRDNLSDDEALYRDETTV